MRAFPRHERCRSMPRLDLVFVCVALFFIVPPCAAWKQTQFMIGAYSEPPAWTNLTETYGMLAAGGFNFVLGGFSANTTATIQAQLEICAKLGIQALVGGYNIFDPSTLPPCANYSSCLGYLLHDEPVETQFSLMETYMNSVKTAAPNKLGFINLLPNVLSDYQNYIDSFISTVKPDIVSFDCYPSFEPSKSADTKMAYAVNLGIITASATKNNLPFWNFFTTMPWAGVADPTAAQVNWQIFTSLAYGAKGVMYFCYWNPYRLDLFGPNVGPWNHPIIRADGTPTRHYAEAKVINAALAKLGPTIMKLTYQTSLYVSATQDPAPALQGLPIANLSSTIDTSLPTNEYLVGVHRHADGRTALFLNNWSDANSMYVTVTVASRVSRWTEVSPITGLEVPVVDAAPLLDGLQLTYTAGEGRLFLFE